MDSASALLAAVPCGPGGILEPRELPGEETVVNHFRDFAVGALCTLLVVMLLTGTLLVKTECGKRTYADGRVVKACNHQVGFGYASDKPEGAKS